MGMNLKHKINVNKSAWLPHKKMPGKGNCENERKKGTREAFSESLNT